ncbi:MAG: hypothetical protein QF921_02355 [Pseudomonadales bacterium]|mgnify:CR=1 FL=1|jgi:hypothetical protein|nr:hypothetical protein [Pseudomonadales bacterium]MDP6472205.1 hypothetical protein [Pseudomonadales bacterium]MDP6826543.1 hypothetical protein [Pseudomonadales bacterium]MDP6970351.1 hypothetical protein [Pseudomonadales bacterium]|tara:strand:+ start:53 stop:250 length:198 start_codon:yes stop_codon:yes gene_type:complete
MKRSVLLTVAFLAGTALCASALAGDSVSSLRGLVELNAVSVEPQAKAWQAPQKKLIERSFAEQPP